MDLIDVFQGILGFGVDVINILFKMGLAFVAGIIALFKGRNFFLWWIGTLIFWWLFFVVLFVPRKYPKFQSNIYNDDAFKGKNPVISSIMALSAIVAKSDGNVSKEEITLIKSFISGNFGISKEELSTYGDVFEYGKNNPDKYQEFTHIITTYYRRRDLIHAIAYLLVSIAMQDGQITDNEDTQIRKILAELGLSEYEYMSIKNSFNSGSSYYGNQKAYSFGENSESLNKKYSKVLEINEGASITEVKKAYRKLVKEYHPDKVASKGMPEEYIEFANKKMVEINQAYEYLSQNK